MREPAAGPLRRGRIPPRSPSTPIIASLCVFLWSLRGISRSARFSRIGSASPSGAGRTSGGPAAVRPGGRQPRAARPERRREVRIVPFRPEHAPGPAPAEFRRAVPGLPGAGPGSRRPVALLPGRGAGLHRPGRGRGGGLRRGGAGPAREGEGWALTGPSVPRFALSFHRAFARLLPAIASECGLARVTTLVHERPRRETGSGCAAWASGRRGSCPDPGTTGTTSTAQGETPCQLQHP
jgi:hypothetical protein